MLGIALWKYAVGAVCAFFVGVAKAGVPGVAIWVVPVMVLTVGDARLAAGWLLPLLCVGDLFAVGYWRKHAEVRRLLRLAPWVLAGMLLGAAALSLPEQRLRPIVGGIILFMLLIYVRRRIRPETFAIPGRTAPWGATAGFATTVANAAGPVMNLYLLSNHLPKERFLGTAASFYFVINVVKIPIYAWHGLFSRQSLGFDALLFPAAAAGAMTGRWVFDHIPQRVFEIIVLGFTAVATLLLFR